MLVTMNGEQTPDQQIAAVARGQHGAFTRRQARSAGLSERQIQHRLELGVWERTHTGVFRVAGSPNTPHQRFFTACASAGPDAVVSHRAAAWLWGLDGPFGHVTEITMPRARATEPDHVVTHRTADLRPEHRTVRHAIPITTPARTIVDLGAVCPEPIVDRAIDQVVARRLVTMESLWRVLSHVARQGRNGCGVLRRCLARRQSVPKSVLEGLFLELIRNHGLPEPVVQYPVTTPEGRRFFLDAVYPDVMLAIELDGSDTHVGPDALEYDLQRQNAIADLGFELRRFTWGMLTGQKRAVADSIVRNVVDRRRHSPRFFEQVSNT